MLTYTSGGSSQIQMTDQQDILRYLFSTYLCEGSLDTCLMSISRFSLQDNVTLRLLKLYLYIADVVEGAGHKAKRLVLQCINGVSSNPVEQRTII